MNARWQATHRASFEGQPPVDVMLVGVPGEGEHASAIVGYTKQGWRGCGEPLVEQLHPKARFYAFAHFPDGKREAKLVAKT